jgi:von Willebrand factor type D domain
MRGTRDEPVAYFSQVDLPLEVDGFEISRIGPKVIATSEEGIGIHCNIVNGLCSVNLSGWYHGKVAGIAGSLDNEKRNDFRRPDGRVVDSVVEFLEQWKV